MRAKYVEAVDIYIYSIILFKETTDSQVLYYMYSITQTLLNFRPLKFLNESTKVFYIKATLKLISCMISKFPNGKHKNITRLKCKPVLEYNVKNLSFDMTGTSKLGVDKTKA